MKIAVVVLLCALSITWANQSLLLDGLLSADQVATDRCLSVSHLNYTVDNLLHADIVAALNTLIADPTQSIGNITNFLKVVYTSALANNQYWLNGFSTNAYFGFSTDSVYSFRNCSLPENAVLQGCMTVPTPAMLAYIRNNVTFAGSKSRHVWSVDDQGNLIEELYVESRESYATQNIWFQTPGWISFTSLTSHLQTFTYSKAVPGVAGVVAASDRSFREPCLNCLQLSPTVMVSNQLNASTQLNQPSTMTDLNNLVKNLYTYATSVEAAQVGFPSGDFVQLKDCSNKAAQPSGSYCSQTTSTYVAIIYAPTILSTSSIRAFNLSAAGQLDTTSYVEYAGYNSTSQQWYAIGQQDFGFSPIYRVSDSSLVRSYVIQHGSGVVVASDTSESECETPTSAPFSTTTPSTTSPTPGTSVPHVASSAASAVVSIALGAVILCLM